MPITNLRNRHTGRSGRRLGIIPPQRVGFLADEDPPVLLVRYAALDLAAAAGFEGADELRGEGAVGAGGQLVLEVLGCFGVDEEVVRLSCGI